MVESSINAVGMHMEAMVAECAGAAPPKEPKLSEGACHMAHMHVPSQPFGKCHPAPGATARYGQPHLQVAVGAPSAPKRTKGAIMFDTGGMVTIVTQAWVKAHELKAFPLPSTWSGAIAVAAFNGKPQPVQGTMDMDLQVGNGVELTLKRKMVMPGSHYQAILGTDVWAGKSGVLGGVVAMLPSTAGAGHFTWHVMQAGVHAHVPFLPLARVRWVQPRHTKKPPRCHQPQRPHMAQPTPPLHLHMAQATPQWRHTMAHTSLRTSSSPWMM